MEVDLNAIVAQAKPWKLSVAIDGKKYPIRRLSSADFKQLTELEKAPPADQKRFVLGLFDGKASPGDSLDQEHASVLLGVVVAYYQETVTRKNFEAAQRAVVEAMR